MRKPANHKVSCLGCGKQTSAQGLSAHICFGVKGHDDIREYWTRKRYSSKCRGVEFNLNGSDMVRLFKEAGIFPDQISSHRSDGYVLARHGDKGPYELGNCRFILHSENAAEKRGPYKKSL